MCSAVSCQTREKLELQVCFWSRQEITWIKEHWLLCPADTCCKTFQCLPPSLITWDVAERDVNNLRCCREREQEPFIECFAGISKKLEWFCYFSPARNGFKYLWIFCLFYFLPLNTHRLKGFQEQAQVLLRQHSLEKVVSKWCRDVEQCLHESHIDLQSSSVFLFDLSILNAVKETKCSENTFGSKGKTAYL